METKKYSEAFTKWANRNYPFEMLALHFSPNKEAVDDILNRELLPAYIKWLYISEEGKELCGGRTPLDILMEIAAGAASETKPIIEKGDAE